MIAISQGRARKLQAKIAKAEYSAPYMILSVPVCSRLRSGKGACINSSPYIVEIALGRFNEVAGDKGKWWLL